jgi:DNA-binding NarL/FixJ family response regulator
MKKPLLINFKPLEALNPNLHDAVQFIPLVQETLRETLNIDVAECNSWAELSKIPEDTAIVEFHATLTRLLDTTPDQLLAKIKHHLKNKKAKLVVIVKKITSRQTAEAFKNLGVDGVSLHSLSWGMTERVGSISKVLESGSYWPEDIVAGLQNTPETYKPLTVYFQKDWETKISLDMIAQLESEAFFKTKFCGSWKDLSDVLFLEPQQIIFNADMITQDGATVFEFMSMLETLIKFTVPGKIIPIGVGIDKDTPHNLIKDLRKTAITGIVPCSTYFGIHEASVGIRMMLAGNSYWPKHIIDQLPGAVKIKPKHEDIKLTNRQTEIFELICKRGLSNKKIAQILNISESTVKVHISAILKTYRVRNRTQLALSGSAQGLRA